MAAAVACSRPRGGNRDCLGAPRGEPDGAPAVDGRTPLMDQRRRRDSDAILAMVRGGRPLCRERGGA